MNQRYQQINFIIDNIALIIIGLFSLGYTLFDRRFAELRLSFSFLDFPIFIGEILLFLCLVLLFIKLKYWTTLQKINLWGYLLFTYICFVLIKALGGYFNWGALAFRHAALFYYPLFAILGYNFYNKKFFTKKKILFLSLLFIFIMAFVSFSEAFLLTYLILTLVLITAYPRKPIRYMLSLLLLLFTPYKSIFFVSRAGLISNLVSIAYLIVTIFLILRIGNRHRVMLFVLFTIFLLIGVIKLADSNALKTIMNLRRNLNIYTQYKKYIAVKNKDFKMAKIQGIRLYNPEVTPAKKAQTTNPQEEPAQLEEALAKGKEAKNQVEAAPAAPLIIKETKAQMEDRKKHRLRILPTMYNNTFFRIFVWEDLLREIGEKRPLFGFDFGKPFRSRNIEILFIADGEWSRDGWIAAHNSFLEIIYRAGIIGVLLIFFVFAILFKLIKKSINTKSFTGILLCGILINWAVSANFLVILELPYNAIPFWALFGLTFACLESSGIGNTTH